jgi:hypothetical protein
MEDKISKNILKYFYEDKSILFGSYMLAKWKNHWNKQDYNYKTIFVCSY